MLYIGAPFTYFSYDTEDESLASNSDSCDELNKMRYVIPSFPREWNVRVAATEGVSPQFLSGRNGEINQVLAMKTRLLTPDFIQI